MPPDATDRLSPEIQSVLNGLMAYEPERVILFGSAARGDADERSDIDLIVVKKTEVRFVQRLVTAGALVPPGISADVFVYTPQELEASVGELVAECGEEDRDFLELLSWGRVLDKYYLSTRYPDALPPPAVPFESFTEEEGVQALAYAEEIVAMPTAKIPQA